jgi:hypothetical protein
VLFLCGVADARAQGSSVRFDNGRVTLDARDVPLRQVLGQWAQVGGVTIVNPDNLPSTIVTLHLVDVPERTALATLLRPVSGYILAARRAGARGPATIDRILILPAGSATRAAAVSGPTPPSNRRAKIRSTNPCATSLARVVGR